MMKRFLYILTLSSIVACNSNTILKKPDNLLPKEKIVDVLSESYIATATAGHKDIHSKGRFNYSGLVYKNQKIDSVTFNESLKYYTSNISDHEEILKLVKISLDKKLEIFNEVHKDTTQVDDPELEENQ